jgi:drug/metabolite transporter (DMT)-like permease
MKVSGYVEAFAYTWVIAALNITYSAGIALGVHPAAFLLEAFFIGAIALLIVAGPGPRPFRIVTIPQTWLYGVMVLLTEVLYYLMIVYVPPADASIFVRLNVPFSIAIGAYVLGRAVAPARKLGAAMVLGGLALAAAYLPGAQSLAFLVVTVATSAVMTTRNLAAELHPWNRAARTVVDKMRVTGLVVLVTAFVGLAGLLGLAQLQGVGLLPESRAVPTLALLAHGPTIVLACIMGGIIITTMQYLMFSSVVKITSENFFAVMVLTPLATLILQEAAAWIGLPGAVPNGWNVLPFIVLIALANILVVLPDRPGVVAPTTQNAPARS